MVADPFAAEALEGAFARQRAVYDMLAAKGHRALVEVLAGMSDAERAVFIENLRAFTRSAPDRPPR